MQKWKPLNMEIRSWVIGHVLRIEQTSSSAIKTILRMFNNNSKTLGNQSSALSLKSKIDLLYDLEEIDKTEYLHLIKLMEIRNQFAHNPSATSFEELDKINPDINKYLLKHESEKADKTQSLELRLKTVFSELFKETVGKLLLIEIEYNKGLHAEMRRYFNDKIVENLGEIWQLALQKNKENKIESPTLFLLNSSEKAIEEFYLDFKISISDYALNTLKEMEEDGTDVLKEVFKPKVPVKKATKKTDKKV